MKKLLPAFLLITQIAVAQQYTLDEAHTSVAFEIAHFKINKVRGSFPQVTGYLNYTSNTETLVVNINIKAASIDTNSDGRDQHLRSADFFDVEKFPDITFKSKRIEKKDNTWVAVGDLTLHGITKEVAIPFSITQPFKDPLPRGTMRLVVNGALTINRKDFGLNWSRVMETGELFVGEEVKIEINSEFYIPKS